MVMTFVLLPWKPELVFTGTSVMGINPETGKFCSHVDYWDSIKANDYFSTEGLWDVFRQMYKTPDLETPEYQILKRTADYEVRKYAPFVVVETQGDKLSGSAGFNSVAGQSPPLNLAAELCADQHSDLHNPYLFLYNRYIFGKNSKAEKIPMTTPVFTETKDAGMLVYMANLSRCISISLPDPNQETISQRKVEGGIAAALKFSGNQQKISSNKKKENFAIVL
uniref:Uncharacterized protein n=1 Tax=Chenopodium quinoa TaxID=63459 RepID=A0A803NDF8_CHEQI